MTNEVPEKIYLTTFGFPLCEPIPQESSNPDTVWSKKPYTGAESIEYTRTDAFIEKACNAYCKVCGHYAHGVPTHICRHDCRYFSDFKNYMKGE